MVCRPFTRSHIISALSFQMPVRPDCFLHISDSLSHRINVLNGRKHISIFLDCAAAVTTAIFNIHLLDYKGINMLYEATHIYSARAKIENYFIKYNIWSIINHINRIYSQQNDKIEQSFITFLQIRSTSLLNVCGYRGILLILRAS